MDLSITELNLLSDLALNAAKLAGRYIQEFDKSDLHAEFKDCGSTKSSQVVTQVDLNSQAIIIEQLQASCMQYDIALLSEENCADIAINDHARLSKDYFWCIDPLDGTLPFIEGRDGYAVSIALVNKAGQAMISAIYLPATACYYHTKIDKSGKLNAYKNNHIIHKITDNPHKKLHLFCDQSFVNHPQYQPLIRQLTALLTLFDLQTLEIISGSGAVVNALAVLERPAAVYIKFPKRQQGGGALWDYCGTACIANAIDAWVSDINGTSLTLNQADDYYMHQKGVLYASHQQLAIEVIRVCKTLLVE